MTRKPILHSQCGAALVVAMLVLAIIAVFSVSMSAEYNFGVQRVSNQIIAQQAYSYLRGTEAVAHKALAIDLEMDKQNGTTIDSLSEFWAQDIPPFALEDGQYTAHLYDLQGRFNLNSLRKPNLVFPPNQLPPAVPHTVEQGIFIRLLQAVGDANYSVSEEDAIAITEAVVDWLDLDTNPTGFNCGEDDAYYDIEGRSPHRTANMPFYSVSELRLICNLPVELYERLLPYITVWPLSGTGIINMNTAPEPVLRSVLVAQQDVTRLQAVNGQVSYQSPAPINAAQLELFLENQKLQGYDHLNDMLIDLQGNQFWPNAPLGLYSDYFLLQSEASIGEITQSMYSVISREGGKIVIVARSTGGL
jgi:general secretion pathway protein K